MITRSISDADDHDEQPAAGDDASTNEPVASKATIARIAAQHEHRAVRQVEHAQRAVDDRQAGADERQKRPQHQAVEHLRDEVSPGEHSSPRHSPMRPATPERGSGVVAELAAERVRLLHQRLAGKHFGDFPVVFLALHVGLGFLPRTMMTGRTSWWSAARK